MSGYLLDTNVISELRKRERGNPAVLNWYTGLDSEDIFLSVLVIGELREGIENKRLSDEVQAAHLDRWLEGLKTHFTERILPVSAEIAELWGRLNVAQRLPSEDGLMAATAIHHNLTLVTRNTRDVARSGARLLNPWELTSEGVRSSTADPKGIAP